ncbi:MAG: cupin-like domain-containing protein [Myxococcales bacterium]|nr:cupin-like domain-containing protein [Myxococcales bacterium]
MSGPRIHVDPSTFEPWRIQALTHDLGSHPLLQLDSLIELGKRQQGRKLVRTHNAAATAGTSFADAPNLHPNRKTAAEMLADIGQANAWMSLLNVQADPVYRRFIDEILDELQPIIESKDPGMSYRAGWIFVTSPGAVTPFHIDHEHNFILQIRGKKRLYTWDPFDREVVSERALELFHDEHSRELVTWKEAHRQRAKIFDLVPGMGGYMPSTAGHMVENGDEPSITISFTYYTASTRDNEMLYRGNAALRRLGLTPKPIGQSASRDALKTAVLSGYTTVMSAVRKVRGRGVRDNTVPYAPA